MHDRAGRGVTGSGVAGAGVAVKTRKPGGQRHRRSWTARIAGGLALLMAGWLAITATLVLAYAVLPPPWTPLMGIRTIQRQVPLFGVEYDWVPLEEISPHLVRAVIASEDARFCEHNGFDWIELERAWQAHSERGRRLRGASTISMQTAKNLFLWPGRSWLRKGLEAWFTVLIEAFWSKERIIEVYLNVAEMGPGIWGAEAAAQHWFDRPAREMEPVEAARLAVILPSPRNREPAHASEIVRRLGDVVLSRMRDVRLPEGGGVCP